VEWSGIGEYLEAVGGWFLTSGLRIALVLIGMMLGMKAASLLSQHLLGLLGRHVDDGELKKRADTLKSVVHYLASTVIVAVATMMILGELGIQIGPVLAAAGVVGVAVGFGAQTLVQDLISGFFIFLEDQIRVGDVVEVAGKSGLVERVTLRMTILRDLAGNVHYVRNGQINIVTNMTKEFSRYVFKISVAYREDVDEVIDVIRSLDEELRADPEFGNDILEPIEIMGLDEFADSAVIIQARTTTKPIQQWRVGREFNRRLKKRFDERGIEIPFPHITLYLGQGKDGTAPPLNVTARS